MHLPQPLASRGGRSSGANPTPFSRSSRLSLSSLTPTPGKWRSLVKRQPEAVLAFFTPLFQFVDEELAAGRSVLVHCLAGAHRAGTAGVSCLMHLLKIRAPEATRMAKTLRPAINPIGDFPALLDLLEKGMEQAGQQLE